MTVNEKIEPVTPVTPIVKPKRKKNYINNADLLIELRTSNLNGQMTPKLAHMLQMLTARYGTKGNFAGYSYIDDMKAYAMYSICKTWDRFDEAKSNNPFAFFTQCIKHSFYQYLNKEKKQRTGRDTLLVLAGLNPSHTYLADYEDANHSHSNSDEIAPVTIYEGEDSSDSDTFTQT